MPSLTTLSLFSKKKKVIAPLKPLDSNTPISELPKSWSEYDLLYKMGRIAWEDPAPPPFPLAEGAQYFAPLHPDEVWRQRALDGALVSPLRPVLLPPSPFIRRNSFSDSISLSSASTISSCASSSLASSGVSSSIGTSISTPIGTNYDSALQGLVEAARTRFKSTVSIISVADRKMRAFVAETGLSAMAEMDRGTTPCSHSMLRATAAESGKQETFVVLDLSKDWRFQNGNYGSTKFYASASVFVESALGDETRRWPIATFCILDPSPRTAFSDEERSDLMELANEASRQLEFWRQRNTNLRIEELDGKRAAFRESVKSEMDRIDELAPSIASLEIEDWSNTLQDVEEVKKEEAFTSLGDCIVTRICPFFTRGRLGRIGQPATSSLSISTATRTLFDLTTRLLSETLDLPFSYLISINSLARSGPPTIQLLSSHNLPRTACFDYEQHLELSNASALLYINVEAAKNQETTGIAVKVTAAEGVIYILGAFTTETNRVLNREDLLFFKSFARDLSRFILL